MPEQFFIDRRAKELEEAFFLKHNQKLLDQLKSMQSMEETKEALREASCIHDDRILEKLVELDIHAEMVAALTAVPLIEVAWADGEVDDKEREAIMHGAEESGVTLTSNCHEILAQWLTEKPGPELLDAWTHYIEGLTSALSDEEVETLKSDLLNRARNVAEASGGFLGLTSKVSSEEQKMLETLENAFKRK